MPFVIDSTGGVSRIRIPTNERGVPYPMNCLVYATIGGGKTLCAAQILNYYYRHGYTIISLSDVKDSIEFGFSMFPPTADYHRRGLHKWGCPSHGVPVKLYHPYSAELKAHQKYPDINFYTLNIKNLTRTDLNYLSESNENKRSIQILLEEIQRLGKEDGLHHLVFRSDTQTESVANLMKSSVRFRSDDPDTFFTRSKMGTEKTSSEMNAYFQPFISNYAITPASFPNNLDIKTVMNDQKHYHLFTTKWVKDDRLKRFYILHLLHELIANADAAQHPILIYLEEIRYLAPAKEAGADKYLAEEIKREMTRFRNMGRGFGIVGTTQTYWDVHPEVLGSFNEIVLGRIPDPREQEKLGKALRMSLQDTKLLQSLDIGEFLIRCKDEFSDEPSLQKVLWFMPPHAHAEGGENFIDWYAHFYPDRMKPITELLTAIKETKQRVIEEVEVLKDKENMSKREAVKQERDSKMDKEKLRIKLQMQKLHQDTTKKETVDERLKQLIYQEWKNATGKDRSTRAIAKKFNLLMTSGEPNHKAVQRAIAAIEKKNGNPETRNDSENEARAANADSENEENETQNADDAYDDADHASSE